jgi:hypothetical protein
LKKRRHANRRLLFVASTSYFRKEYNEPHAGTPEYNTNVVIEKAEAYHAFKDTKYVAKRIDELESDIPG